MFVKMTGPLKSQAETEEKVSEQNMFSNRCM